MSFKTTGAVHHRNWNLFVGGIGAPPTPPSYARIFGSDFSSMYYSDDLGLNWTLITDLPGAGYITFGGGVYVFADLNSIWSSVDGAAWVQRVVRGSSAGSLVSAVYNGSEFAFPDVAFIARRVYFSGDGENWTSSAVVPAGLQIHSVSWVVTGWAVLEESVKLWFTANSGVSWASQAATFAGVTIGNAQQIATLPVAQPFNNNLIWRQSANIGYSAPATYYTIGSIQAFTVAPGFSRVTNTANDVMLLIENGGALYRTLDGVSLVVSSLGNLSAVFNNGDLLVAFETNSTGDIYVSDDDGVTWTLHGTQNTYIDYFGGSH